jgi:hypothetical protein
MKFVRISDMEEFEVFRKMLNNKASYVHHNYSEASEE